MCPLSERARPLLIAVSRLLCGCIRHVVKRLCACAYILLRRSMSSVCLGSPNLFSIRGIFTWPFCVAWETVLAFILRNDQNRKKIWHPTDQKHVGIENYWRWKMNWKQTVTWDGNAKLKTDSETAVQESDHLERMRWRTRTWKWLKWNQTEEQNA